MSATLRNVRSGGTIDLLSAAIVDDERFWFVGPHEIRYPTGQTRRFDRKTSVYRKDHWELIAEPDP